MPQPLADGLVVAGARWYLGARIWVTLLVLGATIVLVGLSLTAGPREPIGVALGVVLLAGALWLGPRRRVLRLHRARGALHERSGHLLATRQRWIPLKQIEAVHLGGHESRSHKGNRSVSFEVGLLEDELTTLGRFHSATQARRHAAALVALCGLPVRDEIPANLAPREQRIPAGAGSDTLRALATETRDEGSPGLSTAVLVAANLTPLAGVLLFGWSVFPLMLLYQS